MLAERLALSALVQRLLPLGAALRCASVVRVPQWQEIAVLLLNLVFVILFLVSASAAVEQLIQAPVSLGWRLGCGALEQAVSLGGLLEIFDLKLARI